MTPTNATVRKTKYLTEAAAAAAIAAILVLLKLFMPFLVVLTMMASAVPIAVICEFHGMKWGVGTAAAEILLVNMIGGPEIGLTTAFYAAALGLALGYGFRHRLSYYKTLHLTSFAFMVEMTYKWFFSIYVLGIVSDISEADDRMIDMLHWVWGPIASIFGLDPEPENATVTILGIAIMYVLFVIEAYLYAYWNIELGTHVVKRLRAGMRA